MLENKAQNSSGKQALGSTKFHALSRVIKEGYDLIFVLFQATNPQNRSDSTGIGLSTDFSR